MLRRVGAAISVLVLLFGLVAAPYAHVHQSARGPVDAHDYQSLPKVVLHAHVTPHSGEHDPHDEPVESRHSEQEVWTVGGFVFQPASAADAPLPALLVSPVANVASTGVRLGVALTQPGAHGPPLTASADLRAPPFLPAAVS